MSSIITGSETELEVVGETNTEVDGLVADRVAVTVGVTVGVSTLVVLLPRKYHAK